MSLQVWLPLTGDLENKGLNPLKFSGNASVYSNGKIGKCYSFNGSSSYLQSNATLNISGDAEFSIAFWMYWNSDTWSTNYTGIVSTAVYTTYRGLAVSFKEGKISIDFWNTRYTQSQVTMTPKTWHHVAVTKIPGIDDAAHCHIYIDGKEVGGVGMMQTPDIINSRLLIGVHAAFYGDPNMWFNGYLNDVRVYDNALSPLEVKELAQGLVLHYKLDNTNCVDSSGYSRNGTPLGTLALSSDTPRYDNALTFNGTNSAIRFKDNGIGNIFNDSWTLSFWIKSNNDLGTRSIYLGGYEQSPYINIEKTNTNRLRFIWNIVVDRQGTAILSDDVWYMITVVASSLSSVKCYINGVLDLTITDTRAALTFPDSYLWYIGRDTRENDGLFFHGNMSDFRLYATALSEADIINLYKTSARIDNRFNIHTNELIESDSRELMACGVVTSTFTHRYADSPAINYNTDGELYYTAALTSNGSTYIKVNPDNSTYYYDFELSVGNGNQFYIGFERWGETKTDYGNGNCIYALYIKPNTDLVKAHYQGTINLGALLNGTEPVDTITLRILNGWSGSTSGGNMSATVHKLSLREVKTLQNTSINKNATILTDEIKEFQKAAIQENGMLQAVNFIEY